MCPRAGCAEDGLLLQRSDDALRGRLNRLLVRGFSRHGGGSVDRVAELGEAVEAEGVDVAGRRNDYGVVRGEDD